MKNFKNIEIYTDGACSNNPGPGGYCAIIKYQGFEKLIQGGNAHTTNNRMELTAFLEALKVLNQPCNIDLYSDSKYLIDSIQKGWVFKWEANNWMRSKNKKVINTDIWKELLKYIKIHKISFHWVKGHSGHEENERCDKIAVSQSIQYKNK